MWFTNTTGMNDIFRKITIVSDMQRKQFKLLQRHAKQKKNKCEKFWAFNGSRKFQKTFYGDVFRTQSNIYGGVFWKNS